MSSSLRGEQMNLPTRNSQAENFPIFVKTLKLGTTRVAGESEGFWCGVCFSETTDLRRSCRFTYRWKEQRYSKLDASETGAEWVWCLIRCRNNMPRSGFNSNNSLGLLENQTTIMPNRQLFLPLVYGSVPRTEAQVLAFHLERKAASKITHLTRSSPCVEWTSGKLKGLHRAYMADRKAHQQEGLLTHTQCWSIGNGPRVVGKLRNGTQNGLVFIKPCPHGTSPKSFRECGCGWGNWVLISHAGIHVLGGHPRRSVMRDKWRSTLSVDERNASDDKRVCVFSI